MIRQSSKD
jgi:hypothetical protein